MLKIYILITSFIILILMIIRRICFQIFSYQAYPMLKMDFFITDFLVLILILWIWFFKVITLR